MMTSTTDQALTSHQNAIFCEQIQLLYGGLKVALAITLLVSAFLLLALWPVANHSILLTWFGGMLVLTGLRLVSYALFRQRMRFRLGLHRCYQIFVVGVLIASLLWCATLIWLFPLEDVKHQTFIIFALVGMCSGGVTTLSFKRGPSLVFITPIILTLGWRFVSMGETWGISLAAACILYFIGLVISSRHIFHNTLQNIELHLKSSEQSIALEDSERRLRTILDTAADAFFLHDKTGRFLDVNRQACLSLGYTRQELLQLSVNDIELGINQQDVEQVWGEIEKGHSVTMSGMHCRKDGSTFPVEVRLGALHEGGRKLFSVLARDVTERKRSEQALLMSEEQARAQYKGMPLPTFTWRFKGGDFILDDFNDAADKFTRGVVKDYLGIKLSVMYADEPEVIQDVHKAFQNKTAIDKQLALFFKHAKVTRDLAMKYAYIPPDMVIIHAEDITARIKTEQQIHDNQVQLEEAQRIARLGNWDWDLVSGKIEWSDEIYRILGYEKGIDEANQENFIKAMHPDDLKLMAESEQRAFQGEPHFDEEWRIITPAGETKYVNLRGDRYFNEQRQPVRMVGTMQDITERKQAEILKSDFISTVSHEIRTPLTSIMGSLSIMENGQAGEMSSVAKKMLRIAYENSQRLLVLINDILDLSKIESGNMAFNFKPVNLHDFINQAIRANQGYVDHHHVEYTLQSSLLGSEQVLGDSDRLMQVMNNLISNAAKFSPRGSSIDINVVCQHGFALVSVADVGPGIAPEFAEKVFDRFSQHDSSSQRQSGGTGLGLNIAKYIVEKHHGKIGFQPRQGGGTIFFVELPLA